MSCPRKIGIQKTWLNPCRAQSSPLTSGTGFSDLQPRVYLSYGLKYGKDMTSGISEKPATEYLFRILNYSTVLTQLLTSFEPMNIIRFWTCHNSGTARIIGVTGQIKNFRSCLSLSSKSSSSLRFSI